MEFKDYYQTLGVDKKATTDDIKKQYRRLARKYHPDVSKEANAEEKFKEVQEAYDVLKNHDKRKAYDQMGQGHQPGQGFQPPPGWEFNSQGHNNANEADFSDFFSSMFGQNARGHHRAQDQFRYRGQDLHAKVTITLHDAFHGATRELNLSNGQTAQTLKVKIPKGVGNGQQIRLKGKGSPGVNGGESGDLYLEIAITPYQGFTLQDKDIYTTVAIPPWTSALGGDIEVPTMGGKVKLKIPENSQSGKKFRLKGKGLPSKAPGDEYVTLNVIVPIAKSEADTEFYKKMQEQFT